MTTLTEEFSRQGYVSTSAPLAAADLGMLQHTCDVLLEEPPEDGGEGLHNIGLGRRRQFLRHRHPDFPDLEEFLLTGAPAKLAQELFGGQAYLFNEQFVVKGAKKGASFAWHQDGAYVGFDHKAYLTVWIALDDATLANGCVYILPRNLQEHPDLDPHEWVEDGSEMNGYTGEDPGVAMACESGSVIGFSSLTLHRSGANTTEFPRRAYICQYSPEPIIDPATGDLKRFGTPTRAA